MVKIYQEGKPPGGLNQTSIHLGESNLAGVQVVYGMGSPGDVTLMRGQLVVISGLDSVVRQVIPKGRGCPLIEEKPHR